MKSPKQPYFLLGFLTFALSTWCAYLAPGFLPDAFQPPLSSAQPHHQVSGLVAWDNYLL